MDEPGIPDDVALALCEEARAKNEGKRLSVRKLMCWGCVKFSESPQARCWSSTGNGSNRGCFQVNELFDEIHPRP
ncbi:MAG: hypothetical protein JW839_04395 [Candidatus Lokiarchaeota archaeon]|nr:hypothetical protein [Candidatus Lokiarchaeota archaeon]